MQRSGGLPPQVQRSGGLSSARLPAPCSGELYPCETNVRLCDVLTTGAQEGCWGGTRGPCRQG
jgi:hypothetical protein